MKLAIFLFTSVFLLSLNSQAKGNECDKALTQARKTCKTDHRCLVQYMTVAGYDVVYTESYINCRNSKNKIPTGDKKVEKEKPSFVPSRKRKMQFKE